MDFAQRVIDIGGSSVHAFLYGTATGKVIAMELFHAVNNNDLLYLQEVLMENPDLNINEPLIGSMTALHMAAEKGYSSCAMILLSAGADVNCVDEFGYTALMNGVLSGYSLVVQKLLVARCNYDQLSGHGFTAMHMAVKTNSLDIVRVLLSAGARPDILGSENESAFGLAVKTHNVKMVELILYGCRHVNPNVIRKESDSPLHGLLMSRKFHIAKTFVLTGYTFWAELGRFRAHIRQEKELRASRASQIFREELQDNDENIWENDAEHLQFLLGYHLEPPTLQHLCRLSIRNYLQFNIWKKAKVLGLPQKIQEYVCFNDLCDHESFKAEQDQIYYSLL